MGGRACMSLIMYERTIELSMCGNEVYCTARSLLVNSRIYEVNYYHKGFDLMMFSYKI